MNDAGPALGIEATLDGLLRDRLGPEATLGAISFEGRAMIIEGARIPLRGAALTVERAEIALGAGAPLGALPLSARLASLKGEVQLRGESVPVRFTERDPGAPSWARGVLAVGALEISLDLGPHRVSFGEEGTTVRLDDTSLSVGPATARSARLAGWIHAPSGPSACAPKIPLMAIRVERAGAALITELAAMAGLRARLPVDLSIDGELLLGSDRAASGAFTLTTPRSELDLRLAVAPDGGLLGSTLRGRLAAEDGRALGLVPSAIRPRPEVVANVDLRFSGSLARPGLSGRLGVPRLVLDVGGSVHALVIEDGVALLDVDRHRFAWQRLGGRLYGGSFTSTGRVGFGREAGAFDAVISWSGVRIEDVPTTPDGKSALTGMLCGAASGELRFERPSLAEHPLIARGQVTVDEPRYLFANAYAPVLAHYGLPRLRTRGKGPITAAVRIERGELVIEPLAAAVEGIGVSGGVRFGEGGKLMGRFEVHLGESYLMASPLLAIPGAFAETIVIPVYLGGTVREPRVQTDAKEILDRLLRDNRVGGAMKGLLARVRRA